MKPDEQELMARAIGAARRVTADLERDAIELADLPDGAAAARAVSEAARRVADELETIRTEDAA